MHCIVRETSRYLTTFIATLAIRISFYLRISYLFSLFSTAKTIEPNLVHRLYLFVLDKIYLGSPYIPMGLKVLIFSFRSLKPPSPKKGRVGIPWATIWTHSSSFCFLLKIKQLFQISLCLTRKSELYSSVVVRRIFCFPLVLAIEARTGFSTYNLM